MQSLALNWTPGPSVWEHSLGSSRRWTVGGGGAELDLFKKRVGFLFLQMFILHLLAYKIYVLPLGCFLSFGSSQGLQLFEPKAEELPMI